MPYRSRWQIDIPRASLPTLIFKSPSEQLEDKSACFLDAVDPDKHYLTPSAYRLLSQRFALGLQRSASFEKGDRLLLFSGNDLLYPVVFMGVIMAGGIFTGANPAFAVRELAHQLKDSDAKYLLCTESNLDTAVEAAKLVGMPHQHLFIYGHSSSQGPKSAATFRSWERLLAGPDDAKDFQWEDLRWPQDACHRTLALNYSSGTTGHPKGVEITHANYVSNLVQFLYLSSLKSDCDVANERARWLNFLPLHHAMSQTINIGGALLRGVSVYIMPKFDFIQMLECVQKYRISSLTIVPPIVIALAKHPVVKKYDLSSVEEAASGAAPLGYQSMVEFNNLWPQGHMHLTQGWGMTELTCTVLVSDPNETSTSNAVGELAPNCEAMIVAELTNDDRNGNSNDAERREITARGPDARGELWVRAPNVMKGYWRNPTATREILTPDGWLKTGDIAYMGEDGRKFYIVDRAKELIKVKGNQVAPAELEALLLDHPAVADAAVVGHRCSATVATITTSSAIGAASLEQEKSNDAERKTLDREEERPRAYLVLRPDPTSQRTDPSAIADFVAHRVVPYKRLNGGVVFVDVIPKNASGKILRKVLRERGSEDGAGSESADRSSKL